MSSTKKKKPSTFTGVSTSSSRPDSKLTTFECHEFSRLYQHLKKVTKGDSSLTADKYELAATSLASLLKKFSPVQSLSIRAADETTLHVFSLEPFTSLHELILNRVPPSTINDIYTFRHQLYRLEIVNSGIPELIKLLAPNTPKKVWSKFKPMPMGLPSTDDVTIQEYKDPGSDNIDTNLSSDVKMSAGDVHSPKNYNADSWQELTHLRLCNCGIDHLDPSLHFLPYLEQLDLSHNDISHIVHLHDCVNLSLLNISHNRIRVLSNLPLVISNIQRLNLSHNGIAMLDGIESLRQLIKLDISYNLLDDSNELDHLVSLSQLRELFLRGNPFEAAAQQEMHYRCRVFSFFMHDCALERRPLPILDEAEMTEEEERRIKSSLFLPPEIDEDGSDEPDCCSVTDVDSSDMKSSERHISTRLHSFSPFHPNSPSSSRSPFSKGDMSIVLLNKNFDASVGDTASVSASSASSYCAVALERDGCFKGNRETIRNSAQVSDNKSANRCQYFNNLVTERRKVIADEASVRRCVARIVDHPMFGHDYDYEFEALIRTKVRNGDKDQTSVVMSKSGSEASLSNYNSVEHSDENAEFISGMSTVVEKQPCADVSIKSEMSGSRQQSGDSNKSDSSALSYDLDKSRITPTRSHRSKARGNSALDEVDIIHALMQTEKITDCRSGGSETISAVRHGGHVLGNEKAEEVFAEIIDRKPSMSTSSTSTTRSYLDEIINAAPIQPSVIDNNEANGNDLSSRIEACCKDHTISKAVENVSHSLKQKEEKCDKFELNDTVVEDSYERLLDLNTNLSVTTGEKFFVDEANSENVVVESVMVRDDATVSNEKQSVEHNFDRKENSNFSNHFFEGAEVQDHTKITDGATMHENDNLISAGDCSLSQNSEGNEENFNSHSVTVELFPEEDGDMDNVVQRHIDENGDVSTSLDGDINEKVDIDNNSYTSDLEWEDEYNSNSSSDEDEGRLEHGDNNGDSQHGQSYDSEGENKESSCEKEDVSRQSESSSLFTINEQLSFVAEAPIQGMATRLSSIADDDNNPPIDFPGDQVIEESDADDKDIPVCLVSDGLNENSAKNNMEKENVTISVDANHGPDGSEYAAYTGPTEFEFLPVFENLEAYFRYQVFGDDRPSGSSPFMYYADAEDNIDKVLTNSDKKIWQEFVSPPVRPEKMIGIYIEDAIELENSDQLLPRVSMGLNDESSDSKKGVTVMQFIFVLTDVNMYIVKNDFEPGLLFSDAPVPILHRLHPLETLRSCTLYFGFQRCALHFHDMDVDKPPSALPSSPSINWRKQGKKDNFGSPIVNSKPVKKDGRWHGSPRYSSMAVYVYMLLTRDKARTHPIITTVLEAANIIRDPVDPPNAFSRPRPLPRVEIRNKDSQLLDQVALLIHTHDMLRGKAGSGKRIAKTRNKTVSIDPAKEDDYSMSQPEGQQYVEAVDVIHSQLLFQTWRKKPNYSEPRTLIITPKFFLLCDEAVDKEDVHLTLLDRVAIKDVYKLLAEDEDDPLSVIFVLSGRAANSSNKVTRSFATRKWRLRCKSQNQHTRVVEECKRICS